MFSHDYRVTASFSPVVMGSAFRLAAEFLLKVVSRHHTPGVQESRSGISLTSDMELLPLVTVIAHCLEGVTGYTRVQTF